MRTLFVAFLGIYTLYSRKSMSRKKVEYLHLHMYGVLLHSIEINCLNFDKIDEEKC